MKFLVDDDSGYYFPEGEEVLLDAEAFEKIANDFHKYEKVEITGMKNDIIEVWIHFPED